MAARIPLPLLAVILLGIGLAWPRLPESKGPDSPTDQFSAARALKHIAAWSSAPRPTGSARHGEVVSAVEAELVRLGFSVRRESGGGLVNLVAAAPGAAAEGVWLVAHSDSVAEGPGAADDGLGLGVLVETARALSQNGPPTRLHLLITDGEEAGLLGAAAHVAAMPPANRIAINVEARGTSGPAYMFQTAGPPGPLLNAWRDSECAAQATSLARTVYDQLPNDTDFTVLRQGGFWGYDFAILGGAWRYHTAEDTAENLDPRSVQQVGDCVLGLARQWLNRPLQGVEDGAAAPAYAQVLGRTVVAPAWLVRLLALATLLLLPRPTLAVWRGFASFAAALTGVAAASAAVLMAADRFWPGFTEPLAEVPSAEPLYALALIIGLGGCWFAQRFGGDSWGPSAAGIWMAVATATVAPEAGYVLIPGGWVAVLRLRSWEGLALFPAFVATLLLTPLYAAIFPALTSRLLPVLAVLPIATLGWIFTRPSAKPTVRKEST